MSAASEAQDSAPSQFMAFEMNEKECGHISSNAIGGVRIAPSGAAHFPKIVNHYRIRSVFSARFAHMQTRKTHGMWQNHY